MYRFVSLVRRIHDKIIATQLHGYYTVCVNPDTKNEAYFLNKDDLIKGSLYVGMSYFNIIKKNKERKNLTTNQQEIVLFEKSNRYITEKKISILLEWY